MVKGILSILSERVIFVLSAILSTVPETYTAKFQKESQLTKKKRKNIYKSLTHFFILEVTETSE